MKILFDAGALKDINSLSFVELPSYRQISHLISRAICTFQPDEYKKSVSTEFQRLGIESQDLQAEESLKLLISNINKLQVRILPSATSSGVYTVEAKEEKSTQYRNLAVFKIGHKRAAIELQARKLAFKLGLEQHVIPSCFAALENPDLFAEEDVSEALWNGKEKIFVKNSTKTDAILESDESSQSSLDMYDKWFLSSIPSSPASSQSNSAPSSPKKGQTLRCLESLESDSLPSSAASSPMKCTPNASPVKKTPQSRASLASAKKRLNFGESPKAVVGIIQPYLNNSEEIASPLSCVQTTMAALAIGLRDAKEDGIINETLIDVEDCMPSRLDAPQATAAKWTEFTCATHLPYLDTNPSSKLTISHDDLQTVAKLVTNWDINKIISELADESIQFKDRSAEQLKGTGVDDGGCHIKIQNAMPQLFDVQKKDPLTNKLFCDAQLAACRTRLERMKSFILKQAIEKNPFTAVELVFSVDPDAKRFYEALTTQSSLRASTERTLSTLGPFHVIGQQTPHSAGIRS